MLLKRVPVVALMLCVLGCNSDKPPPPPPNPQPVTVPVASAQPSGSAAGVFTASAVPTAPPKLPKLPEPPKGIDADAWHFLGQLCPLGLMEDRDGKLALGCRSHPPWSKPGTLPDNLAPRGKRDGRHIKWDTTGLVADRFIRYVKRIDGAFSKPGAQQAIVHFENCWPIDGITITGCAALVERNGEKWKALDRLPEAPLDNCVVNRRKGKRDRLVCYSATGASYESIVTSIFSVDFGVPEDKRRARFAALSYNAFDPACMYVPPTGNSPPLHTWGNGIVDLTVKSLRSKDLNGDGAEDITLEVERVFEPMNQTIISNLRKQCGKQAGALDANKQAKIKPLLSKPSRFNLQFHAKGDTFEPARGTARVMKIWESQHGIFPYTW